MGVPSFYRWLTSKYPTIVVNAIEERGVGIDTSLPNPNGLEFDNLYLDMNGIIHPCFHPDDHPSPPTTFQDVFNDIYDYIDRLFCIVRPRKILYMAIDGVAPRAKMNQQRSRRFKTSKDNEIAEAEENKLRREFERKGKQVFPKLESEVSDSNIITPGTQFMYELSKALQSYINQRLNNDPGWKDIKVILSDANVPGEGEHKIMSFIRLQRTSPDYNPNTRHCLYGLDADLIMLALATHEVHFSILREEVLKQEQQSSCESAPETSLGKAESSMIRSTGWLKQARTGNECASLIKKPYQFLHVWILRDYLEIDMGIFDPPENIKIDLERIIDDFVFICFFSGNDFLPHMPTLEIHEGAIDLLMHVYKEEFKKLGGYLVDVQQVGDRKARYVKLSRIEKFILSVGTYEEKIFKKRSDLRERRLRRFQRDLLDAHEEEEDDSVANFEFKMRNSHCASANGKVPTSNDASDNCTLDNSEILKNTKELKEKLKSYMHERSDLVKNGSFRVDKVKLGTVGWKKRYYKEKFSAETPEDVEITRKDLVQKYTEGLCWVLLYYFSGVSSWKWFYPYHYGPFASDLKGLAQVTVKFQKGLPFKPFDQLMGVLPPRSAHALPKAYRALMTSEKSNIIDFYPSDFEVDVEGRCQLWQGICKLSFIEEERLLSETKKLGEELEEDEAVRNSHSIDKLFVKSSSKLGSQILSIHNKRPFGNQNEMIKESIDTSFSGGISGFVSPCELLNMVNLPSRKDDKDNEDDIVLCAHFELPNSRPHVPRPLEGVHFPEKTISEADIVETVLWHEIEAGSRPSNRFQIEEKYRRASKGINSSSTNSASSFTGKGAGSGWAGRGKEYITTEARGHSPRRTPYGHGDRVTVPYAAAAREIQGPSSSWDTRRQGGYPVMSTCEPNFNCHAYQNTYNSNDKLKAVGSGRGEPKGFRDSRISESSQGFKSYGRAQSVNHNFNEKSNAVGYGQGEPKGIRDLRISESSHGFNSYGRAQSVSHNFMASRNSSTSNGNYEWRPSVQPTSAPPGQSYIRWQNGYTENTSRAWQHNQSSAATASMQARGRGQYEWRQSVQPTSAPPGHSYRWQNGYTENTSRAWQHNQSSAATPPMQARGRGQYVPKTSPNIWNSGDSTRTTGNER